MKILICATQFKGGSVQVVLSLLNEFKNFAEHEYIVAVGDVVERQLDKESFPANFTFYPVPTFSSSKRKQLNRRAKWMSRLEEEHLPDAVLMSSGPVYWTSKTPMLMGYNLPAYIYPESPYWNNRTLVQRLRWRARMMLHRHLFRKEAVAWFVQTDDVNLRLKKWLERDAVYTISNTVSNVFKNPKQYPDKLPARTEGEFRFLTITAFYLHKNLEIIPDVIAELKKRGIGNVKFVVTLQDEFFRLAFRGQSTEGIVNVGPVKSDECPSLYKECDYMFLPTLLECFSASYAEAMMTERPIVTTDMGFAHTVCGNAALYYKPMDAVAAADQIEKLINDKEQQETLVLRGKSQLKKFGTAADRARQVLDLLEKIRK